MSPNQGRRGSFTVSSILFFLDLPDMSEMSPNQGRRGSFTVSSALGYEGIKQAQLSPNSPTSRRGRDAIGIRTYVV